MISVKKKHFIILKKWLIGVIAVFLTIILIITTIYSFFYSIYADKFFPGIYIGNLSAGGKNIDKVRNELNHKINNVSQAGIPFSYQNQQIAVMPTISSLNSDLAYDVITFDIEKTLKSAYSLGRNDDLWHNFKNQIKLLFSKNKLAIDFEIYEPDIEKILKSNFGKFDITPENARLDYQSKTDKFIILPEKLGNLIDYTIGLSQLKNNLADFNFDNIILHSAVIHPKIKQADIADASDKAMDILDNTPIVLAYASSSAKTKIKEWKISKKVISSWLEIKSDNSEEEKPLIGLNSRLVAAYLTEVIAPNVNIPPINSKFKIKDGKVIEFQKSKDGQELNIPATFNKLEYEFIVSGTSSIAIIVSPLQSPISADETNSLGISEIIGTGHSNFKGSPRNRRHNIQTGADTLNGLLIKPQEEFSLVTTLGSIDAESGYLPELVIKGNKTIPEFGGGLCQIGTTMFRAVTASGLPVTMRRNHSYRVSYYEPAGTDATIYDPMPDFKFINDTNSYILIQTRIEGDDIYFDFWGTKDGRIATQTYPIIHNIIKPEQTKIIETTSLKPGEKKCTEKAHNGADAFFDYTVTYPSGEIKEKRFSSHYIPWREVCLLGVEKLSEDTANSTKNIIE
jgi:vancomycin resistance protein YoaR